MFYLSRFCSISHNKLNILRRYCTKTSTKEYIPIYKFPYVRACGIINQLKYYQSIITTIVLPSSFILNNYGFINDETLLIANTMGITGTLSLFLLGIIPYKLIGFVYVNDNNKTIKIAYLDFWGKRKDNIVPLNDLVPLSDLPVIPTDPIYLTMRRYSNTETYKINIKFGMVLQEEKFKEIFLQNIVK